MASEDSKSIVVKMNEHLTRVEDKNIYVVFGFVRSVFSNEIPDEIINYCVVYAYLKINHWYKGGQHWKINNSKLIASGDGTIDIESFKTIYANPIISKGKHEWKIKILFQESEWHIFYINIGIATSLHCLQQHFHGSYEGAADNGAKNYVFVDFTHKMSHEMQIAERWAAEREIKNGDTITTHLNMDEKTLAFSINDEYLGVAFDNIDNDANYRFAICMIGKWNKTFEFVE